MLVPGHLAVLYFCMFRSSCTGYTELYFCWRPVDWLSILPVVQQGVYLAHAGSRVRLHELYFCRSQ